MAAYFMKCDCGADVLVHVGDKICQDTLCWFRSYHCINCGKAIELDDADEIPPEIRQIILEQDGTYELYLCNEKDRGKAEFLLKKLPVDNMKMCNVFVENKTDVIIRGTQNEVLLVKLLLEKRGICCQLRRMNS